MNRLVFHIAMAFTILVGCAQQPVTHNFVYSLPETAQKTRPVTIALVDPFNANPTVAPAGSSDGATGATVGLAQRWVLPTISRCS